MNKQTCGSQVERGAGRRRRRHAGERVGAGRRRRHSAHGGHRRIRRAAHARERVSRREAHRREGVHGRCAAERRRSAARGSERVVAGGEGVLRGELRRELRDAAVAGPGRPPGGVLLLRRARAGGRGGAAPAPAAGSFGIGTAGARAWLALVSASGSPGMAPAPVVVRRATSPRRGGRPPPATAPGDRGRAAAGGGGVARKGSGADSRGWTDEGLSSSPRRAWIAEASMASTRPATMSNCRAFRAFSSSSGIKDGRTSLKMRDCSGNLLATRSKHPSTHMASAGWPASLGSRSAGRTTLINTSGGVAGGRSKAAASALCAVTRVAKAQVFDATHLQTAGTRSVETRLETPFRAAIDAFAMTASKTSDEASCLNAASLSRGPASSRSARAKASTTRFAAHDASARSNSSVACSTTARTAWGPAASTRNRSKMGWMLCGTRGRRRGARHAGAPARRASAARGRRHPMKAGPRSITCGP